MTRRRARPATAARPARGSHPPARPEFAGSRWLERACLLSPLVALAALAWSLRGAPLGTPVADDFEFIHRVVFRTDADPFGTMGASFYWRPLSRQLWFPLVTPLLLAAPWVVAAIHVTILATIAFLLARIARRVVPWPAAALVAAAVLATEPARALVTWSSGIQHLLAALGLALTAHEGLAGRRWSAAPAAVLAALSHELGALAFVLLGAGGFARRAGRAAWLDAALAAALAAAWALGYRTALAHGLPLPEGGLARAGGAWLEALRLGLAAAFNTETLAAIYADPARVAVGVLFGVSLVLLGWTSRRDALRDMAGPVGVALAVAWLGIFPLASLLPDWNAWRAFVPALALAFAITLACARAHPALGLALVAVRLAALAGAEPAGPVAGDPPPAVSDLSFTRLTRMQRVVAASEPLVRGAKLPSAARVAYLGLPEMTMNGFRRDAAVQVWTRDPLARFVAFEGSATSLDSTHLVISYDTREGRDLAITLTPDARRYWLYASNAADSGRWEESRRFFLRALAAQRPESPSLSANALRNLALREIDAGRYDTADSLNREAFRARGTTPEGFAVDALIALGRGDLPRAERLVADCLALAPGNALGRAVLEAVQTHRRETGPPVPAR